MSDMRLFNNSQFGTLEVVLINGKEYFPATDCAKMLGYADPHKAIKQHCREDGWVNHPVVSETTNQYGVTTKQTVQKKYITEGNLYRLISHSKLPAAEKFEKWIFDEVIPSIRATGGYGIQTISDNEQIAKIVTMAVTETIKQLMPLLGAKQISEDDYDSEEVVIKKYKRRKPAGKIEKLPASIRQIVDEMLYGVSTFTEIQAFLKRNGYGDISNSSIFRYKNNLFNGKAR